MNRHATSIPFPQHTIDDLFAELQRMNGILERLASQPAPESRWVSAEEYAALTHRSVQAVRKRCRTRGIGVRVNGKWRIAVSQK
jgi:hypothetical protein